MYYVLCFARHSCLPLVGLERFRPDAARSSALGRLSVSIYPAVMSNGVGYGIGKWCDRCELVRHRVDVLFWKRLRAPALSAVLLRLL